MPPDVGGRRQQFMDAAGAELLAASRDPTLVQVGGDGLNAERVAFSARPRRKDLPPDLGLILVRDEDFLVLGAAAFGGVGPMESQR